MTHVLFVATTTNWEIMRTVCGHYDELGEHVYCLWSLLRIGRTHVLFVATTINSVDSLGHLLTPINVD